MGQVYDVIIDYVMDGYMGELEMGLSLLSLFGCLESERKILINDVRSVSSMLSLTAKEILLHVIHRVIFHFISLFFS